MTHVVEKFFFYFLLIATLVLLSFILITQIKDHYRQKDPMLSELKNDLRKVFPDIDNVSLYEGDKSYTINKHKIYLCLKDAKGKYYNKNMLIFVLLHELAHVRCDEIGHTKKFHNIFEDMLKEAEINGLYNPSIPVIQDYCEY